MVWPLLLLPKRPRVHAVRIQCKHPLVRFRRRCTRTDSEEVGAVKALNNNPKRTKKKVLRLSHFPQTEIALLSCSWDATSTRRDP